MPRYVLETTMASNAQLDAAVELFRQRFPELTVEHRYTTSEDTDARVLWVCRAPSKTHLDRWAATAGLEIESLRQIETHTTTHGSAAS